MKVVSSSLALSLLALTGCASIGAPSVDGRLWSGKDGTRLVAQLRSLPEQLPQGWLFKVQRSEALGSFAYRKRAPAYDYSEHGYFAIDAKWRSERTYIGVLEPGGVFCVVNPEMQGDVVGNTVNTYQIYDYCVQLHSQ